MTLAGDVLVVCGSLHPTARAQIDAAPVRRRCDRPGLAAGRRAVRRPDGCRAGGRRARRTPPATCWRHGRSGCSSSLGGDTAAAVLGDEPMVVGGTLAPGVPWSQRADGSGPLVITKAGGFGHPTTLVDLLAGRPPSEER